MPCDYLLELAAIAGRRAKNVTKAEAYCYIFGYTVFNDLSARDAQLVEMEGKLGPAKGKDFDGANVFGPCIVTADEIGDPYGLTVGVLSTSIGRVQAG
jgi:2-keto-4-pentenoate hydratase/2-oxohepta-3-ene-1,7-dioic acid hydratase in catechol pathway